MNIHKELDIDLKKCTDEQIKNVAKLTAYHSNVLLRNQELTKDDYARILALWGDKTQHHAWYEDPDYHQIQYVTNRAMPELGGKRGIFPQGELEWHCNGTLALDPEDCVTLYCVVPTKDRCDTIFLNGVEAYNDLPNHVKKTIDNTMLMITSDVRSFHRSDFEHLITRTEQPRILNDNRAYTISEDQVTADEAKDLHNIQGRKRSDGPIYREMMRRKEEFSVEGRWKYTYKKLVHEHTVTGQKGLYFPFLNVAGLHDIPKDEQKELYDYLVKHYLKYEYSHDWKTGDLMLFDQTQALHKRQPFPTKGNGEQQDRLLWRGAFYYDGVQ
ncbi:TauD/TfdA family dioxygenase [Planktomarina temperata]|jgi:alpha-ketoglutarate-dependent taurine dioxygenase|nr:TauD/TfdA family dioxygenase [Planktomarina temperata]